MWRIKSRRFMQRRVPVPAQVDQARVLLLD